MCLSERLNIIPTARIRLPRDALVNRTTQCHPIFTPIALVYMSARIIAGLFFTLHPIFAPLATPKLPMAFDFHCPFLLHMPPQISRSTQL